MCVQVGVCEWTVCGVHWCSSPRSLILLGGLLWLQLQLQIEKLNSQTNLRKHQKVANSRHTHTHTYRGVCVTVSQTVNCRAFSMAAANRTLPLAFTRLAKRNGNWNRNVFDCWAATQISSIIRLIDASQEQQQQLQQQRKQATRARCVQLEGTK